MARMSQQDRHKKLNGPLGSKIKEFLGSALVDAADLPGKTALRARIAEEFGDVEGIDQDKLYDAFLDYARRGQDKSKRWGLRGHIFEVTLNIVTKLEEADRLMPVETETDDEIAAAVEKGLDPYRDRIGGDLDRKRDQERAAAQELLRKAGR
jgi:hypothetical protein